jgi:hypothetical protein
MDEWIVVSDAEVAAFGVSPDPLKRIVANRRLRPTDPSRPRAVSGIRVRLPARRDVTLYDMPWVKVSDVAVLVDRHPDYVRGLAHRYGIPLATLPNRQATRFRQNSGGQHRRGRHTVMSQSAYRAFLARYWNDNARMSTVTTSGVAIAAKSEADVAVERVRSALGRMRSTEESA